MRDFLGRMKVMDKDPVSPGTTEVVEDVPNTDPPAQDGFEMLDHNVSDLDTPPIVPVTEPTSPVVNEPDTPSTQEPTVVQDPPVAEPVIDPPPPEGDVTTPNFDEINRLSAMLLAAGINPNDGPAEGSSPAPAEPPKPAPTTQAPKIEIQVQDIPLFESDEEFEKAFESRETFTKVAERIRDNTVRQVLESLPVVIANTVRSQVAMTEAARDFYRKNEDLRPVKSFVGLVANEVFAAHPGKTPEELESVIASEVRKRLNIIKSTEPVQSAPTTVKKPGLPGVRPAQNPKKQEPTLTGIEAEIASMLEHTER